MHAQNFGTRSTYNKVKHCDRGIRTGDDVMPITVVRIWKIFVNGFGVCTCQNPGYCSSVFFQS